MLFDDTQVPFSYQKHPSRMFSYVMSISCVHVRLICIRDAFIIFGRECCKLFTVIGSVVQTKKALK